MRAIWMATAALAVGALLAGCGKKEEPVMPEAASEAPAAAAAPAQTPEQQKALLADLPSPFNTADLPTARPSSPSAARATRSRRAAPT